jgi:hypothetical protein
MLAQHQRTGLARHGYDVAVDFAVHAQASAETDIALNLGFRADQ